MLSLVYPEDPMVAKKIVEDLDSAPITNLHKAAHRWVKKFVRSSAKMTSEDTQALRDAGVQDKDIAAWAQYASMQTWFVMMGDGGGINLDGDMEAGFIVGKTRPEYEQTEAGLLAADTSALQAKHGSSSETLAWIATDESNPEFQETVQWGEARYGFVPNISRALSLAPTLLLRDRMGIELLERPQSKSLSARQHALVRAKVASLNKCDYFSPTIDAQLDQSGARESIKTLSEADQVILKFAEKVTTSTYKVIANDAQGFRDVGLDDEAYVDVLNTVAIQTSLERMANSLGVPKDEKPLLA